MKGTEKQVAWAEDIKAERLARIEWDWSRRIGGEDAFFRDYGPGIYAATKVAFKKFAGEVPSAFMDEHMSHAKAWIEGSAAVRDRYKTLKASYKGHRSMTLDMTLFPDKLMCVLLDEAYGELPASVHEEQIEWMEAEEAKLKAQNPLLRHRSVWQAPEQ